MGIAVASVPSAAPAAASPTPAPWRDQIAAAADRALQAAFVRTGSLDVAREIAEEAILETARARFDHGDAGNGHRLDLALLRDVLRLAAARRPEARAGLARGDAIHQALLDLPDDLARVVILRDALGLPEADAAEALAIPTDLLRARLSRARRALARLLERS